MQVCKASQCWGYTYYVSLIFKCKLVFTFIIAFNSSELRGTGVKYSDKRVPDDAKSLQILHHLTALAVSTISAYMGNC